MRHWRVNVGIKKKRLIKCRARANRITKADKILLTQIREIKQDHPFWGYRRMLSFISNNKIAASWEA